ncbi:MAG: glycine zipper family protein [Pseudomonadota bacterium]
MILNSATRRFGRKPAVMLAISALAFSSCLQASEPGEYSPSDCRAHAQIYADRNAGSAGGLRSAARGATKGAIAGAIFGDSSKATRRGAKIGALAGILGGAIRKGKRKDMLFDQAYQACLKGNLL